MVCRDACKSSIRSGGPSAAGWTASCATARTRTRRPASTSPASKRPGVATARQLQGKQLSYNNINDTDAAFELVAEFDPRKSAAVAIIKHANPCGVAIGDDAEGCLREGAALRSGLGLRRHRRRQPHARRRSRRGDRQDFHRGDHRAGCDAGGRSDHCGEEEPAPAGRRRSAGSARGGHDGEIGRRRAAGADARQCRGRRSRAESRHQAHADSERRWPTCASPSASPSM